VLLDIFLWETCDGKVVGILPSRSKYKRDRDDIIIGVRTMGEVDSVRDMIASLLAEVGFSCSFNVGRKVRYLGYQLHFKCGRILILYIAPIKTLSRRFTLRLTEHFSRYEEMERGLSQR